MAGRPQPPPRIFVKEAEDSGQGFRDKYVQPLAGILEILYPCLGEGFEQCGKIDEKENINSDGGPRQCGC